jgi:homoserine O-acetyltransferase
MRLFKASTALAFASIAFAAAAADFPAPKQGDWIVHNFKFRSGEVMPELRIHYVTVGEPTGQPVLILHGTTGSNASMLGAGYAGVLFGPGQPLDASKYYLIIPDSIGHGKSSKPSDGLRAKFPHYDYSDMVEAQYRLLTDGLNIHHLRLVTGNSMGGMETWIWGEQHPDFMDALVPMAAQPTAMASRNWMLRRMLIETIKNDPDYKDGNYTTQPHYLKIANVFFGIATLGGTLNYQNIAPTQAKADKIVTDRLAAPMNADANDFIWQWQSSADYDAAPDLEKIKATVLAINAADDERNPPETGILEKAMKRVAHGSIYLIPASIETRGHGTTSMAKFYKQQLDDLLKTAPRRAM